MKQLRSASSYQIATIASDAIEYLNRVSRGYVDRPNANRIDVCKFVVNHCLGTPRQKVEHTDNTTDIPLEQFTTEELRGLLELTVATNSATKRGDNYDVNVKPNKLDKSKAISQLDSEAVKIAEIIDIG